MTPSHGGSTARPESGLPLWVKALAVLGVVLVALFLLLHLTGNAPGGHAP